MSALGSFVTAFCSVCVMVAGLHMLCPSGSLEKAVKYIFSLVFLLCVVSAFPGLDSFEPRLDISETEIISESMDTSAAEWAFRLALQDAGIKFSKITVCTDNSATDGIIINKVVVYSSEPAENIREILGGDDAEYAVEVVRE